MHKARSLSVNITMRLIVFISFPVAAGLLAIWNRLTAGVAVVRKASGAEI
jgi:hypothetical protein